MQLLMNVMALNGIFIVAGDKNLVLCKAQDLCLNSYKNYLHIDLFVTARFDVRTTAKNSHVFLGKEHISKPKLFGFVYLRCVLNKDNN